MSNQNEIIFLDFLKKYTDGIKPFNFAEIKGAVNLYDSISVASVCSENNIELTLSSSAIDNIMKAVDESKGDNVQSDSNEPDVVKTNQLSLPIDENDDDNQTYRKWKQSFVDEISSFVYKIIAEKKNMSKKDMMALLENQFLNQVPIEDKEKVGKCQPKYVSKFHKTIYNNLIKANKVEFHNGIYNVVKENTA